MISKRFTLVTADFESVLRGATLAMLGAFATYVLEWSNAVNWGEYQVLAAAVIAVVVNLIRKFITEHKV